jgi:hypothetical protein
MFNNLRHAGKIEVQEFITDAEHSGAEGRRHLALAKQIGRVFPCCFSLWLYLSVRNFAPSVYKLLGYPDWERQCFSSIISTQTRIRIPADHCLNKKSREASPGE